MDQKQTVADGGAPSSSSRPRYNNGGVSHYYASSLPEGKYVGMKYDNFQDAILDLDYKTLYSYECRDPNWVRELISYWKIQKALQVITPSSNTYVNVHNSKDVYMVWGVFSYMQTRQPDLILERHLAAVMPVFLEEGLRMVHNAIAKQELTREYTRPWYEMSNFHNHAAYFFHCFWGPGVLDLYVYTPYQVANCLGDIHPDAMQYFYINRYFRPPHEEIIAELKKDAIKAYERGKRKLTLLSHQDFDM